MLSCSCLCQSIAFEVELKNLHIEICHCSMCRKMMGSSGFLGIECISDIQLPGTGIDSLGIYNSSENGERGFCKKCGTSLYYYFKPEAKYFVPVGIIDNLNENDIKITTEIYYDNKPCYYNFDETTQKILEADFK